MRLLLVGQPRPLTEASLAPAPTWHLPTTHLHSFHPMSPCYDLQAQERRHSEHNAKKVLLWLGPRNEAHGVASLGWFRAWSGAQGNVTPPCGGLINLYLGNLEQRRTWHRTTSAQLLYRKSRWSD